MNTKIALTLIIYIAKKAFFFDVYMSLNQDISHGLDEFFTVICWVHCGISACVRVIRSPSRPKADSRITTGAKIFIVTQDTNSSFGIFTPATNSVEPFLITMVL